MARKLTAVLLAGVLAVMALFSGCAQKGEALKQLDKPKAGDKIAVMDTSMGVIRIRLFPEVAPKAVENFTTHAENHYYDGLTFHRVINDFMIQSGDPEGTGSGGESIWGQPFEDEFSDQVVNLRGSLAMANRGPNTNGSQFFINQAGKDTFAGWDEYEARFKLYQSAPDQFVQLYGSTPDPSKISDEIKKLYEENGGNVHLDGAFSPVGKGHTVFGQVYEGMDVVDKIAAVDVDDNGKPKTDVILNTVRIEEYAG